MYISYAIFKLADNYFLPILECYTAYKERFATKMAFLSYEVWS